RPGSRTPTSNALKRSMESSRRLAGRPVVSMNKAIAAAENRGPQAGLEILDGDELSSTLDGYHYFHAARADFLDRMGESQLAEIAWKRAMDLAPDPVNRAFYASKCRSSVVK